MAPSGHESCPSVLCLFPPSQFFSNDNTSTPLRNRSLLSAKCSLSHSLTTMDRLMSSTVTNNTTISKNNSTFTTTTLINGESELDDDPHPSPATPPDTPEAPILNVSDSLHNSCSPSIDSTPPNSIELLVINVVDEFLFSEKQNHNQDSNYSTATPISCNDITRPSRARLYRAHSANSAIIKTQLMVNSNALFSQTSTLASSKDRRKDEIHMNDKKIKGKDNIVKRTNVNGTDHEIEDDDIDEIVIVYPDMASSDSGLEGQFTHNNDNMIINHIENCDINIQSNSNAIKHTSAASIHSNHSHADNGHTQQTNIAHSQLSKTPNREKESANNSQSNHSQLIDGNHRFSPETSPSSNRSISPQLETLSSFSQFINSTSPAKSSSQNSLCRRKHLKSTPTLFSYDSALSSASTTPSPCPSPTSCPALSFCHNPVKFILRGPEVGDEGVLNSDCEKNKNNKRAYDIYLSPINGSHSPNSNSLSDCGVSSGSDVSGSISNSGHVEGNRTNSSSNDSNDNFTSGVRNTLHSLPPSVVISDHSLDEVRVVHDYDLDYNSTKQVLAQMNPSNDLGNYLLSGNIRRDSLASICSSTSSLSSLGEGDDYLCDSQYCCTEDGLSTSNLNTSPWRKIRSLVTSPFIQTYKRQKYPWIQLAGHQGNFMAGSSPGTILKKLSGNEKRCFEKLMCDTHLKQFVPEFKETITSSSGEVYLELEDLLAHFTNPSIMDIKMGLRTYLEEELIKAGEKPKLRKDMYEKMVAIDPNEPKPEEHSLKAVTKPRYMIWRESISSTSTLGFRIDGVKLRSAGENNNCSRMVKHDFKRTKTEESVRTSIELFADKEQHILCKYYNCLENIREALTQSEFFAEHEMIGSSLLFVHDDQNANVWLIDFAKTYPLPDGFKIDHSSAWTLGNHEDGYLVGLDNLIRMFGQLCDNADDDTLLNNLSRKTVSDARDNDSSNSGDRECENVLQNIAVAENNPFDDSSDSTDFKLQTMPN